MLILRFIAYAQQAATKLGENSLGKDKKPQKEFKLLLGPFLTFVVPRLHISVNLKEEIL